MNDPSRPVRVAVIGAGVMGRHHAHNYLALPHAELAAIVEPDPVRRAEAARLFECDVFASTEAMLARKRIDAASVVAPTSMHHPITMDLLEAGAHVLVEKPVAATVREAKELVARSRHLGLVLQVGHITRFFRAVRLLNERVREPYLIEARRTTSHARIQDVGVILDLMIHDIDIVMGLVPAGIREMTVAGHVVDGRHEDVAAAQITFENGCIARFLASRIAAEAERSLVVAERDRTFRVDFLREPHTEIAVMHSGRDARGDTHLHTDRQVVHEDNPLRAELGHFLKRIGEDAAPIGTLEDDLRSLHVATDMIARLRTQAAPGDVLRAALH